MPLFSILLAIHIVLAISLLLPSLVLPFALRARGPGPTDSRFVASLIWLQSNGTLVIGAGLALTGIGLIATLGAQLLEKHWLLAALALYAINLGLAFFVQRPGLHRLLGVQPDQSDADRQRWTVWARRQRYVSYVMAGAIGLIAFLMSTKPQI